MKRFGLFSLLLHLCFSGIANAHTSGASFLGIRAHDDTIEATFDFDLRDLNQLLHLDGNLDGALTWGEIDSAAKAIEQSILDRVRLSSGGCRLLRTEPLALAQHGDGPFARIAVSYRCSDSPTIDYSAWLEFDPGHRGLVEYIGADGVAAQSVLSKSTPTWHAEKTGLARISEFLLEGALHLVGGYDHLAFLGVLLLALMRRPKNEEPAPLADILKRAMIVITAFTLAHSFTLALAATGTLVLPSKPVEVTIAASVLLAAVLNLWRRAGRHGPKLAFAFGLVHGLGFAGALAEMASGGIDLLALAAFNVGIEAAQLIVALIAVPLMWAIFRSTRNESVGLPVASLSVAALAGFWVAARL